MGGRESKVLPQGLTYEEIEIAKVLSGYSVEQIIRIHAFFVKAKRREDQDAKHGEQPAQRNSSGLSEGRRTASSSMLKGETVAAKYVMHAIPELNCPLTSRMYKAMNVDGPDARINFNQTVNALMVFNENAPLDEKMKFFFKVFDADEDGQLSREDIKSTLQLVMTTETEENIDHIVHETFEEVNGNSVDFLTMSEYSSVVGELVQQRCTIFF